jgi:hypothetical protein
LLWFKALGFLISGIFVLVLLYARDFSFELDLFADFDQLQELVK